MARTLLLCSGAFQEIKRIFIMLKGRDIGEYSFYIFVSSEIRSVILLKFRHILLSLFSDLYLGFNGNGQPIILLCVDNLQKLHF